MEDLEKRLKAAGEVELPSEEELDRMWQGIESHLDDTPDYEFSFPESPTDSAQELMSSLSAIDQEFGAEARRYAESGRLGRLVIRIRNPMAVEYYRYLKAQQSVRDAEIEGYRQAGEIVL